jgi:hypothetical protein
MDSWYASQKLMGMIDGLGKIYYCPLKENRVVDDTGGVEKSKKLNKCRGQKRALSQEN